MRKLKIVAGRVIVSALVLTFMLSNSVYAFGIFKSKDDVKIPTPQEGVYVYDDADMITSTTESEINELLDELRQKTTAEVVVVSYNDSSVSLEDYAYKVFNMLGIGDSKEDNGVLLLMQKTGNHVRIEVGNGLEGVLTDSVSGRILDNNYVKYRDSDTSKAALETCKVISAYIYKHYGIDNDLSKSLEQITDSNTASDYIIIGIVLLIIFIAIVFVVFDSDTSGGYYGGGSGYRSNSSSYHSHSYSFGGGHSSGGGASR